MEKKMLKEEEFWLIVYNDVVNKYVQEKNKFKRFKYKIQLNDIFKYLEKELHKTIVYDETTKVLSLKDTEEKWTQIK